jgi:hypothetical protein
LPSCWLPSGEWRTVSRIDPGAKRPGRVVHPRPDGAVWNAENLGDLREWQADIVMEHDDRPVVRRQRRECALELIPDIGIGEGVGSRRLVLGDLDLSNTGSTGSASVEEAEPNDEPIRPCLEAIRVAKAWEFPPDRDERLLDRFLGAVRIARDSMSCQVESGGRCPGQRLIRVAVPSLRSLDGLPIQSGRTFPVANSAATVSEADRREDFQSGCGRR